MAKEKGKEKAKQKKSSYYKISDGKISSKKLSCPKCGAGVFMAEHNNRNSCGKCGFTQMK